MPHYLEPLFAPQSIAVVGASERTGAVGRAVFDNLLAGGFKGALYPVNPKHKAVSGSPCVARLTDLAIPADLAVITAPAAAATTILADAAKAGMRHALLLSPGFGETGAANVELERKVKLAAKEHGVRLLGPRCLGLIRPALNVYATYARGAAHPGQIALVSQSNAVCAALMDWAWTSGIGFSSVVAMGGSSDVDLGDVLDYLMFDGETRSILLYAEGVTDARRFVSGLRACARTKPIVVLKAGRHEGIAHAAISHAGSMVGDDAVFGAVLERCGAVRVHTYAQLFAIARLLAAGRLPNGRRLAILTNGRGPGLMATDAAGEAGVDLAELAPATLEQLTAVLPPQWSRANPVDIPGDVAPQGYGAALGAILADPGIDGVLTLFSPRLGTPAAEAAVAMLPLATAAVKPVLTAWLGETEARAGRELIEQAGMPAFHYPESGVHAFAALAEYMRAQRLLLEVPPPLTGTFSADTASAHRLARAAADSGRTVLDESESKQLLAWFGIPTPRIAVAATIEEAARLGDEMGYPLALKIVSPDIIHKSDVGGVTLNVRDAASLAREFRKLLERVGEAQPQARLTGVALQPMVSKRFGRELLIGVARDPVFGQVISFGAGGVAVELLRDHAIGLPPLNQRLAEELVDRTRMGALLAPFRHIPGADRQAIIDILIRVSEMVCALPWLMEMDINPLSADDRGAIALDARVVIDPARLADDPRYTHMAIHPYPSALVHTEKLRDGAEVLLRPIRPEDAQMELAFVGRQSDDSRYMRFFNPIKNLPPRMLARLTQVDYDRELALLATTGEGADESIAGVVRYSPNADGASAEFAVTVDDQWHGRGLGRLLMQRLIEAARSAGYRRLTGSVLASNQKMHGLMRALGFTSAAHGPDPSINEYSLDLGTATPARPT